MIELTEAECDGPEGVALIAELLADINQRYGAWGADLTEAERAASDAEYLGEVTADAVRRPHGVFVVAWLDGTAVGCGALRPYVPYHDDLEAEPGVAEVKRMYTTPSARRRGVSRAVLARLEAVAAELGYRRLLLETGSPQPEAMALYERSGWEPIEPYGHYRDEPESRCYAKDLPG